MQDDTTAIGELPGFVRTYYYVKDQGNEWHLTCRRCRKRWALKKARIGAAPLFLLNHAYSHLPAPPDDDDE